MASRLLIAEPGRIVKLEHRKYDGLGEIVRVILFEKGPWFSYVMDIVATLSELDPDVETRICVETSKLLESDDCIIVGAEPRCAIIGANYVEVM